MNDQSTGLAGRANASQYAQFQQGQQTDQAPVSSSLDGIRKRIEQIAQNVHDMHGIADRACGHSAPIEQRPPAPPAVPNGMLDEIENALDSLVSLSNSAVARLSRIA